jgi:hypothetical protein
MSWRNVPKKENYFPLFAEDWNALVDAVDDLYYMLQTLPPPTTGGPFVGGYLYGDLLPWLNLYYSLGDPIHRFLNVWAKNIYADPIWTSTLYASNNIFVNDKPVLKDGDPISIYDIQSQAQNVLSNILQQYVSNPLSDIIKQYFRGITGNDLQQYVTGPLSDIIKQYFKGITVNDLQQYVTGPMNDYKNQIISQLVTIQSLLQNTNTLINSHLVRELYETYSYMFQFNNTDGVITLFTPQMGYRTIIRGWYVISTGTSGIGQMKGQYSLTPVGLIPFSIPYLSFPDIWLGLYYDEPLLLYYNNISLGTYLQLMLNITQQWTGVSLIYPSEIDPNLYIPPSGWKAFLNFVDPNEIQEPYWSWDSVSILQVKDGLLTMRGITGGLGYVQYDNTDVSVSRGVVVFRVRDVTGNIPYDIVFLFLADGSKSVKVSLYSGTLNPDGTITASIYDYWSYSIIKDNITLKQGEYYVLIYDFNDNTMKLIDTNGNIIVTANPTVTSVDYGRFTVFFDVSNGVHTVDVDWMGAG